MKNIELNTFRNNNSNQKLATILRFISKTATKHLIDLKSLIVQIILAQRQANIGYYDTIKGTYCVYYCNSFILSFLKLLKEQGFIFNYYLIPQSFLIDYTEKKEISIVLILFNYDINLWINSLRSIKLVSTSNKIVSVTWIDLKKIIRNDDSIIYILSTNQGLITHLQAREKRLGGKLLCIIN